MSKKRKKKKSRIDDDFVLATYEAYDDGEMSLERLLNMVADTCGIPVNEVCYILERKRNEH